MKKLIRRFSSDLVVTLLHHAGASDRIGEAGHGDARGNTQTGHRRWGASALLVAVMTAVAALSVASLDRELRFYDAGVYVVTAKAIAAGVGYRNANLPGNPPQGLYPPAVPIALAAVWRLFPKFPDNLVVMRVGIIICGLLFLAISHAYLIRAAGLSAWEGAAVIAVVGLHPLFLRFALGISSEIPYALASIVALYAYARFLEAPRLRWFATMTAGLVAAVLTRTIGIALLAGVLVDALLRRRTRVALSIVVIGSATMLPWSIWSWWARTAYGPYPPEIAANYRGYVANLATTNWLSELDHALSLNVLQFLANWSSFILPPLPVAAAVAAVVFFAHPIPGRMVRNWRLHDAYCLLASAMIILWPWPLNGRFVLVLSPFLAAYCVEGIKEIVKPVDARWKRDFLASLVVCLMAVTAIAADGVRLVGSARRDSERNAVDAQFHEMTTWIKANTDPRAVLITGSDPLYYLFTDRKTVRLAYPDPFALYYAPVSAPHFSRPERLLAWFRAMKACYVIQDSLLGPAESRFDAGLIDSLRRAPSGAMTPLHATSGGSFLLFMIAQCEP